MDNTKELKSEVAKLTASKERLESLIDMLPSIIVETDLQGNLIYANKKVFELTGFTKEDLNNGLNASQFVIPEERSLVVQNMQRVLKGEKLQGNEYTGLRKDGTTYSVLVYSSHRIENGETNGTRSIIIDITERKRVEEKLKNSQIKHKAIVHNIPGMIYKGFPDWSSEIISGSKKICGYSSTELNSLDGKWLSLIHPDDREKVFEEAKKVSTATKDLLQVYRIIPKDGNIKWVEDHKTSLFSDQGEYDGVYGVVFDVTDRKRMELELLNERNKLQVALDEVKTLQGIIPICSHCKQIRDDKGFWNRVDNYIEQHTNAQFSHGVCPECVKKHYPKYVPKEER